MLSEFPLRPAASLSEGSQTLPWTVHATEDNRGYRRRQHTSNHSGLYDAEMDAAEPLYVRRYRVLVRQLLERGSQREVAERLGVSQPLISGLVANTRGVGVQSIELAIANLSLDRAFFYDESLGPEPRWTDHVLKMTVEREDVFEMEGVRTYFKRNPERARFKSPRTKYDNLREHVNATYNSGIGDVPARLVAATVEEYIELYDYALPSE